MPVYIQETVDLTTTCHAASVYGEATGAAITFAQTGPFAEGTKAVFECYDDFTVGWFQILNTKYNFSNFNTFQNFYKD